MRAEAPYPIHASVAGRLLSAAAFALCVYRATQGSITHDEAMTYAWHVEPPFAECLVEFSANHHVLNTVLCHAAVGAFGASAVALRLPCLLGALLYLVAIDRLRRRWFSGRWSGVLVQGLLVSNPFVLDHLWIARGYGLALGCQAASIACFAAWLDPSGGRRARSLEGAGLFSALSALANLTFVPSACALACAAWCLGRTTAPAGGSWTRNFLPFAAAPFLAIGWPLLFVQRGALSFGADSAAESATSLVLAALGARSRAMPEAATAILGLSLLAVAVPLLVAWRAGAAGTRLRLVAAALGIAISSLAALHCSFGLRWPADRTGLHLVVPCVLALGLAAERLPVLARRGMLAALAAFGAFALTNIRPMEQRAWPADAPALAFLRRMEARHEELGRPLRIACSWDVAPSYEFYRRTGACPWLAACDTRLELGVEYDFYVFHEGARGTRVEGQETDGRLEVVWISEPAGHRRLCLREVVGSCGRGVALLAPE